MAKFPPNEQQQAIIDHAETGQDGRVMAGAGVGKTTTLRMIAETLVEQGRSVLYLAFNRSVADAAEKEFPKGCLCRNYHRLAWRHDPSQVKRRGGTYASAQHVANLLGAKPFAYRGHDDEGQEANIEVQEYQIGVTIKDAINVFCQSADRQVSAYHVSRSDVTKNIPDHERDRFIAHVLPYVTRAWDDIADPKGTFPYIPGRGDSCYVKLWSLSDPQLGFDVILYDEAQDANAAVAHVVSIQQNTQRIYVGDSAQAIYGWNGAIDALAKFESDWTLPLSHSYRFGQVIADRANTVLDRIPDAKLRLTGSGDSEVRSLSDTEVSAILCRTNAGCIESAMGAQAQGKQVYIAGGVKDIEQFVKGANDIISEGKTQHPQLAPYRSWSEVQHAANSGDADFGMQVKLVDNYGTHTILEVCRNCANIKPWQADVVVSTVHKAKGLEWDHVRINSDFKAPKEGKKLSVPEAMLIYVAVTRAKKTLDDNALAWMDQLEQDINETMDEGEEA